MRNYHAVITRGPTTVTITPEVQAWNTAQDTWTWIAIDNWDLHTTAKGADLKTALVESLTHRGWITHNITHLDLRHDPSIVTIEPTDWTSILTRLIQDRDKIAARLAALDMALPNTVVDATDTANPNNLTIVKAARLIGITRGRIYQQRDTLTASMTRAHHSGTTPDPHNLTSAERDTLNLN